MLCLGIESSCDETAVALVRDGILEDSLLASQVDVHAIFGGVVPELASREHCRFIGPLFDELIKRTQINPREIDLVAVARGPGLLGCLLVGVAFAKGLALALGKHLLGINHLHAHLLANGLEHQLVFPAIGLLVSGGHTNLYLIKSPSKFQQLGRSVDDAAGECLDKTGSILGLPYPGGKMIDNLAMGGVPDNALLPRPNLHKDNLDFSFSGLKTAAARASAIYVDQQSDNALKNFCASLNAAVVDTLLQKLARALSLHPEAKAVWLAGGVAANTLLRAACEKLAVCHGLAFLTPSSRLCTDNAAMIAYSGFLLGRNGFSHGLALEAIPRGKMIPDDMREEKTLFASRLDTAASEKYTCASH